MPEPSNYQLYVLIRNRRLQAPIRKAAQALCEARNIGEAEQQQVRDRYQAFFQPERDRSLGIKFKLLVLLFPFAPETGILQAVISSYLLRYGHRKSWRSYWAMVMLGHLIWLIVLLTFSAYLL